MSFITWLKDLFGSDPVPLTGNDLSIYADEYAATIGDIYIREMAFWSAVNLIANAVSKCEFKTYEKNKEVQKREYYLWNYEPNKNQNSSAFIQKWIAQLCRNNEALIIEQNGQLLVADNFNRTPYALFDDVFTQVTVGDFVFNRSFTQSEVMYFNFAFCDMRKVTNGLYESYSRLITYSMNAYQRSRGTKGIFKFDTIPLSGTAERAAFDSLVNEKISKWLSGDNAALPLGRGQAWEELKQKTYSSESTRDIRAMIDDVSDFTAKAFGIPPALLRGDVQGVSDALDNFLTFCIDPLVDKLSEEINRKRNGYAGVSAGSYLKIDTRCIKHIDILNLATSIDKLIGSGVYCVNDILKLVGEQPIDEPWAYKHFVTKNYMPFDEAVKSMEGGE